MFLAPVFTSMTFACTAYPSMGVNPSTQYSAAAMGHGSYRPLHPQQHASQQQQQQQHYPQQQQQPQPPMRTQPQQQQTYGALNGPSAAATASSAGVAKNIPLNSYGSAPAAPLMHPQYQQHGVGYGAAPTPIRPAMYHAESASNMSGHPHQPQQQQQQPKPYQPYAMQTSYSMPAQQHFMSESTAQQQPPPHAAAQPAQVSLYFPPFVASSCRSCAS